MTDEQLHELAKNLMRELALEPDAEVETMIVTAFQNVREAEKGKSN